MACAVRNVRTRFRILILGFDHVRLSVVESHKVLEFCPINLEDELRIFLELGDYPLEVLRSHFCPPFLPVDSVDNLGVVVGNPELFGGLSTTCALLLDGGNQVPPHLVRHVCVHTLVSRF